MPRAGAFARGSAARTDLVGPETPAAAIDRACDEQVASSAERMLGLLNDSGHVAVEVADFDLRGTIEQVCAITATRARLQGIELRLEVAESGLPRRVRGDRSRLRQVLMNLVVGAIRSTRGGAVVVRACVTTAEPGRVALRCEIAGTGAGPGGGRRDRTIELARELIEPIGGAVTVATAPFRGAAYVLVLELEAGAQPGAGPVAASREGSADHADHDPGNSAAA
jgi:hypothetical protein